MDEGHAQRLEHDREVVGVAEEAIRSGRHRLRAGDGDDPGVPAPAQGRGHPPAQRLGGERNGEGGEADGAREAALYEELLAKPIGGLIGKAAARITGIWRG